MKTIQDLRKMIEEAIEATPYPIYPEGLYEPIKYALSMGGKRIRPVLLLLAYGAYRDDVEKALPAAIGLETYHNHTLLHDDLMDKADLRRGKPTVHKKWNDNTAVLSGDAMLIQAFQRIAACGGDHAATVTELFLRTAIEICEGQQYDVNFETRTDVTEEEYLKMIRLKTSVLLGCAARMGALLADAPETDADALYNFAEKLGLAFQLQDDYLDVYGDPSVFGKNIGGDILCGKKTYLLINALNRGTNAQRQKLLLLLADHKMDAQEKIREVTALYNELGIKKVCAAAIDAFYGEARQQLERTSLPQAKKAAIWDFAASLLHRQS